MTYSFNELKKLDAELTAKRVKWNTELDNLQADLSSAEVDSRAAAMAYDEDAVIKAEKTIIDIKAKMSAKRKLIEVNAGVASDDVLIESWESKISPDLNAKLDAAWKKYVAHEQEAFKKLASEFADFCDLREECIIKAITVRRLLQDKSRTPRSDAGIISKKIDKYAAQLYEGRCPDEWKRITGHEYKAEANGWMKL